MEARAYTPTQDSLSLSSLVTTETSWTNGRTQNTHAQVFSVSPMTPGTLYQI